MRKREERRLEKQILGEGVWGNMGQDLETDWSYLNWNRQSPHGERKGGAREVA